MSNFISRALQVNIVSTTSNLVTLVACFLFSTYGLAQDALQAIYPSEPLDLYENENNHIDLMYASDSNGYLTNGLAFRIHFNSDLFDAFKISDALQSSLVTYDLEPRSDISDIDKDSSTDKFLSIAWADLNQSWPGSDINKIITLEIKPSEIGLVAGSAKIRFSEIETSVGYLFSAEEVRLRLCYALDNDRDCIRDELDLDDDNDGIVDEDDLFPFDGQEWLDTDGDGTGNNADTDDDGDDVLDEEDA
ncbi:MAG: hypothetical protein VW684_05805, partial [Betaproteobacteria bacterium]